MRSPPSCHDCVFLRMLDERHVSGKEELGCALNDNPIRWEREAIPEGDEADWEDMFSCGPDGFNFMDRNA